MDQHCQKVATYLNDAAGDALLDGEYKSAAVILAMASHFAQTDEGAAVLRQRALETQALANAPRH